MFLGTWSALVANLLLRHDWRGGLGQIIGIDFTILYSAGWLYRTDILHLYDFQAQMAIERRLIAPTALPGSGPFSNPPFTAAVCSLLTYLPLTGALALWSVLAILAVAATARLALRYLAPAWLAGAGLTQSRSVVIILSSFAFVEGFYAGQSHAFTMLLVTGICVASLTRSLVPSGSAGWLTALQAPVHPWLSHSVGGLAEVASAAGVGCCRSGVRGRSADRARISTFRGLLPLRRSTALAAVHAGLAAYLLVTPFGALATLLSPEAETVSLISWITRLGGLTNRREA